MINQRGPCVICKIDINNKETYMTINIWDYHMCDTYCKNCADDILKLIKEYDEKKSVPCSTCGSNTKDINKDS